LKFNLKKLNKIIIIPGLVLSSLSIGIMQNVDDVNAYNYITTGSYNGMNATNKAIINNLHSTYSTDYTTSGVTKAEYAEVLYASAGPITTSVEGLNNISGYQWTGWFDKNKKDFTIDKSVTGNFGTTTKGGKTYDFSTDRTGYYKYLRDPIYSEVRAKANQTFTWVTKKRENLDNEYKQNSDNVTYWEYNKASTEANNILKKYSIDKTVPSDSTATFKKAVSADVNKQKKALANNKNKKATILSYGWVGKNTIQTYKVNGHVVYDDGNRKTLLYGSIQIQVHRGGSVYLSKKAKNSSKVNVTYNYKSKLDTTFISFYDITYKNYSKNIQIADTVIARNVSATELSKYKTFYLVSNGGANTSNSTSVSKGNGGWWGSNHPSYHQGNDTTSDSGGWYTWRNDTSSGSKSINLRNAIPEKEKEFNFAAVPSNIGKDNTSTLHINPNGGTYNGNGAETQVKQRVYTFYTVASAIRDGYTLTGWDYSGGGVWNPNTNKYQFNLVDGYLTAKWTDNNDPSDPSNPDDKNKKYTLTVDPNGGKYKGKTDTTKIIQKKGTSVEVKNPTRSGYLFVGWDVVAGNSNFFSPGTNSSMYKFYGDATIKAQWVKKNDPNSIASVTIDPNGGTYEGSTSIKKITGTPGTSTIIKTPVREGHVFKGWDISNIDKNKYESPTFTFVRGDTTMKARWEKMIIPPCQIGASGKDSCGGDDNEKAPGIWVHLNKDIFS